MTSYNPSALFIQSINQYLDNFAAENGYSRGIAAALAVTKNSTIYGANFEPLQTAYDSVWQAALLLLPQVTSGTVTLEDALAQLPALEWDWANQKIES
jgi:hypothetical protein